MKAKKIGFIRMRSKFLLVPLLVFFFIITGSTLSFGEETGSIELGIKYTNGDKLNTWQTTIRVLQDDGDISYVIIENPKTNPFLIESLPLGHKYYVEVYVNNMFAESSFLNLEESEAELNISIPLSGGYRFIVLYNDGETPIKDATLTIKSHDGHQWNQENTDAQGITSRFWMQSNNLVVDDFYIAEVSVDEELIYTYSPVVFSPSIQGDIKIVTPWPKKIEDLITISVYTDISQKVSKSDGKFVAELYDIAKNKVAQSSVNIRGEAFFSNLKVGKYLIQVVKSAADPSQESEIWGTREIVLSGEENSVSVFKKGIFSGKTCNCVAFRLDDVQDWYLRGSQVELMKLFQKKKVDITVGIIGGFFGDDPHLVDFLKKAVQSEVPKFEIASHSWNNSPLVNFDKEDQRELLVRTNDKLFEVLGVTPKVLIPPQNLFDDNTLALLPEFDITHISAHIEENHSPPYLVEDSTVYYFPANTQTAKIHPTTFFWENQPNSVILDEIHSFLGEFGYAVVMMHPYEFTVTELGVYTGDADTQAIAEVGKLIDELRDEGIKLVTINEINENVIETTKPVVVKPDVSQDTSLSCDCVAFRFTQVQDYYLNDVQIEVFDIFKRKGIPITTGIIGNLFGNDVKLVDYIKNTLEDNDQLIEIANNGWNYEDFTVLTSEEQSSLIKQGNDHISSVLGITPDVFIPPYEKFNDATILALHENKINHISSTIQNDPPPYPFSGLELYHFPEGAVISQYKPELGATESIPFDETFSQIQKTLDQHGFAVVTMQPSELAVVKNGNYINQVDDKKFHELELLIDRVQAENLKLVPIGEINIHAGGISIPNWIKNNAGWWSEGFIGDSDFVSGIQFLINEGIMRVPPTTPESAPDTTDEIPSWIKNNARWWAEGVITDTDFVSGIQWLITNGIIKITAE